MNRSPRVFQLTSLLLLVVCFAQAAWWVVEETQHAAAVRERVFDLYAADAVAAGELRRQGATPERVEQLFPALAVAADGVVIRPDALAALDRERRRRINRFGWEGSFFLLVLLGGMGVIVQALRANNELLRRQQNFLASVSHELKSPLASVKLSAETLLLRRPDPDTVARLANRMVRDADRLTTLVSNLLDVARLEEGKAEVAPSVQPLRPLVDAALRALEHDLSGIDVAIDVPADLLIWADGEALRTCVRNLASNAAKSVASARGAGAPTAAGKIAVRACAVGARRVEIAVVDDGVGFPRQEKRRIFEKFYRPGDELRRRTKGSGLGLYLVRELAGLHGAKVVGSSPGPGQGATFTLRWPAGAPGGARS
jgi:signal transduction histidine kinase